MLMDFLDALILVVDDLTQNLQVIGNMLESAGFDTTFSTSGRQAIERVKIAKPDLILLDLMMPEMSGLEVCEILKADPEFREIPIIFLTANTDTENIVQAFEIGASDYITKPFKTSEVLARINNQLVNVKLKKQLQLQNQKLQQEIAIRRTAEADLAQAKEAAEAANKAKSAFLANMSHELRSPLNAILGFAQLLARDTNLTVEQQTNLNIVYRSGEHLLALINDILDLSKIEAGRITLNPSNFDLLELLHEIDDMLSLKASNKNLLLNIKIAANVPRYIRSDRLKLRQVLINLVSNAIKFTEQGQININVNCLYDPDYRDETEYYLLFAIADTGIGIASQDLSLLFQPFTQTQSGLNSQEGTGLGLAISRRYVQLLGGEIDVTSQIGRGTTFQFEVPIIPVDNPDANFNLPRAVIGLARDQPEYRILIADDRPLNSQLLIKMLVPIGFCVETAANGSETVAQWQTFQPHLIWMDLKMPGMDGYEATRQIRALESSQGRMTAPTKIIALTASAFEDQKNLALDAGCDDFVRKPFIEAEIFAKMKQYLNLEYIYDSHEGDRGETEISSAHPSRHAKLEQMKQMPPAWIERMQKAVLSLDIEAIAVLIADIPPDEADLAAAIREYTENFNYDPLLQAIANCASGQ
jgi:signal transduction histidine kinase